MCGLEKIIKKQRMSKMVKLLKAPKSRTLSFIKNVLRIARVLKSSMLFQWSSGMSSAAKEYVVLKAKVITLGSNK